ncbi:MAG TPA: SpoIVB peptidase S55 domain-containing protein [Vicinamibacterales bacterium]|nr:SpoIVB peptidase S55 domain-containing protein [Vicinamibacterales bacterium]
MRRRLAATVLLVALLLLCRVSLPARSVFLPVDEVRPGMIGVGRTVFDGATPEDFTVRILGVLRNVVGPQRNLILARLEGGPLASTGVIQGMSGSPVFIDGRLVGAVAYSVGAFSKEPIAGITPIGEMLETTQVAARQPVMRRASLEFPLTAERLASALRAAGERLRPFADRPGDVVARGLPLLDAARLGTLLHPIATPLVMSGFAPEATALLAPAFEAAGFAPAPGGSDATSAGESDRPLAPGDAVGVRLLSGDLELGATGTVTWVDGDRVYAFGHQFLNLGPTAFPMTRARVYSLVPSLMTSFKIAALGEAIGTFQQDRATALAGALGAPPRLVPITIELTSERGLRKTFSFAVVDDQLFTPLLTYAVVFNTLASYERQFGVATFSVRGRARIAGRGDVVFEDLFTGENPIAGVATSVAGPLMYLLSNDLGPVEIAGLDLAISSAEEPRVATIERVWLDEVRPRAGRAVPLKILLRTYRGEAQVREVPIEIPANVSGTVSILVADGAALAQWEQRELRRVAQPETIDQMIRRLNESRRNNRIYVRLLSSHPGAVVEGETLSALPPSVLAVLEAERNGGSFVPLRHAVVGEWDLPTEHAVSGSRLLTVRLEPGPTAR